MVNNQFSDLPPFPEKDNFNKILIILAIAVFSLIIIFLMAIYLLQKNRQLVEENLNTNQIIVESSYKIPLEPEILYQRGGTIIDLQPTFLILRSQIRNNLNTDDPNLAYELKDLIINLDENTHYLKRSLDLFRQTKITPPAESSSKSELKIGDQVNIRANVNIKNLTTFTATEVELIY